MFGASQHAGEKTDTQCVDLSQVTDPEPQETSTRPQRKRTRSMDNDVQPQAERTSKRSRRVRDDPPNEKSRRKLRTRKT